MMDFMKTLAVLLLFSGPLYAALPVVQQAGTARAMAMGSAVVGIPLDSASLLWNPAGLGLMDSKEIGLHHNSGLGDAFHEIGVFGIPTNHGGLAVSLDYGSNGSFEGRDSAGRKTGDYGAQAFGGSLGYGRDINGKVSAGASIKYNRKYLADDSYSQAAGDLGVLWNVTRRSYLGVMYANIGDKKLDAGWRVGGSYNMGEKFLMASSMEIGSVDRINFGIEGLVSILALRAGYVYSFTHSDLDGLTGVTLGMGVKVVRGVMLDYALVPHGELGDSHRLSLTYKFLE